MFAPVRLGLPGHLYPGFRLTRRLVHRGKEFGLENQSDKIKSVVPPDTYSVLTDNFLEVNKFKAQKRKGKLRGDTSVSVLEKIMMYNNDYEEKTVLICEQTAERIIHNVRVHSVAEKDKTVFVDMEGGLCMLAARTPAIFKEAVILEKDAELAPLHQHAKDKGLDENIKIHNGVNINSIAAYAMRDKDSFSTPLTDILPQDSYSEQVPSYTFVATGVSHGAIKYLAQRMLFRSNPLGEFYSARPEMFLVVTARTYFHLCCGKGNTADLATERLTPHQMRRKVEQMEIHRGLVYQHNVLFQLMFDFCLVDTLPREAFFPQKPHGPKGYTITTNTKHMNAWYQANASHLMLLYMRPKPEEDLCISNPVYFNFFLHYILKKKATRIICTFEEWCPGSGLCLVQAGYTVFTELRDISVKEMLRLYYILEASPNFGYSPFVEQATVWAEAQNSFGIDQWEMDTYRNMTRKALKKQWKL